MGIMNSSILDDVKDIVGVDVSNTAFDKQLILYINSVLRIVNQIGVGKDGYNITDSSGVWSEFLEDDLSKLTDVKSYVGFKVLLMFDHTLSSIAVDTLKSLTAELESRINYEERT